MNQPCDLIQRFEKNPQLPKGDGEILSVYGVESCPFASGDVLCSRHVLASSFGPAYTAIWHRDPDGGCASLRRSGLSGSSISIRRSLPVR